MNFTVRDLVDNWPSDPKKIVLLEDGRSHLFFLLNSHINRSTQFVTIGSSAVPGFEAQAEKFILDMKEKGLTVTTCAAAFS